MSKISSIIWKSFENVLKNITYKLDLSNFIWENILPLLKTICIDISQLNAIQIWIKDKKEKYDEENSRNG